MDGRNKLQATGGRAITVVGVVVSLFFSIFFGWLSLSAVTLSLIDK